MKAIIDNGYLYIACPPLFALQNNKEIKYIYNQEELDELDTTGYNISHFKGLGEMNSDELWETTMNPDKRKLIQVSSDDIEESEGCIITCMGKEVEARKDFIFNYLVF